MDTTSTSAWEEASPPDLIQTIQCLPVSLWCPLNNQRVAGAQSEHVCHRESLVSDTASLRGICSWQLQLFSLYHTQLLDTGQPHVFFPSYFQLSLADVLFLSLVVGHLFI